MKKKLLFLGAMLLSAFTSWAQTSPYTGVAPGDIVSGNDYYLYNVESGLWLQSNDRRYDKWVKTGTWARGWTGVGGEMRGEGREPWMVIEWWQASANMKQTIHNVPAGKYEVSCYGFYRDGDSNHEAAKVLNGEELIQNAFLVANDERVALPNITSAAGKGYLVMPATAKTFFPFGDETTAIEGVIVEQKDGSYDVFNLHGQKIMKAQKGVNIINGKKVVIK